MRSQDHRLRGTQSLNHPSRCFSHLVLHEAIPCLGLTVQAEGTNDNYLIYMIYESFKDPRYRLSIDYYVMSKLRRDTFPNCLASNHQV